MRLTDVAEVVVDLDGVRRTAESGGFAQWCYHRRVVASQLDDTHIVIRSELGLRDTLLRQFPTTFSAATRFHKHMMVVADLEAGDAGAIENTLVAA